jgi:hypothetical protein
MSTQTLTRATKTEIRNMSDEDLHDRLLSRGIEPLVPGQHFYAIWRTSMLNRILLAIAEEPDGFDMSVWAEDVNDPAYLKPAGSEAGIVAHHYSDDPDDKLILNPSCGTVGCVAWWTVILFPTRQWRSLVDDNLSLRQPLDSVPINMCVERDAAKRIEISDNVAYNVFRVSTWNEEHREAYDNAKTSKDRVVALRGRLQELLDTGA